jgi:hypothetical protein
MSDLTLKEKLNGAEIDAREREAEKHFFDAAQPFFPLGFSVGYRNPGHWDIYAPQAPGKTAAWLTAHGPGSSTNGYTIDDIEKVKTFRPNERAFCIRGEPGNVVVRDERWNPHRPFPRRETIPTFRSVMGAMLYIMEELMQEPEVPDTSGSLIAVEFGYRQCEKGNNLQAALAAAKTELDR